MRRPAPSPGDHLPGLVPGAQVAVTSEAPELAGALVEALTASGYRARLADRPGETDAVILLTTGLSPTDSLSLHSAALDHLRQLAPRLSNGEVSVVLLQESGGDLTNGPSGGWREGLTGLAKTARLEFPNATIRCLDIGAVHASGLSTLAMRIISELETGGFEIETGLAADGRRLTPELVPLAAPQAPRAEPLTQQDVFLVSGGGRGVTADCVIALARATRARFVLLGRTEPLPWPEGIPKAASEQALRKALIDAARRKGTRPRPADIARKAAGLIAGRDIRSTLQTIEAAGGEALYLPANLSDPNAIREAVATAHARFGPVSGLIHGAGRLADKRIADKTAEQVAAVFAPKVEGLQHLEAALAGEPLKRIVLFASAAGRYGNVGQADYAMANEILARRAWALAKAQPEAQVLSLGWGPWDGGMVDETLRAHFAAQGIELIGREAGAALFAELVTTGRRDLVELCIGAPLGTRQAAP